MGFGLAPAAGVIGGVGALVGGPVALLLAGQRQARMIAAAVPETLERVGAELRSGGTVATALATIAGGDGPLAADIARLESRVRLGASLPESLRAWAGERPAPGVEATAGALALSTSVGGRAADALDALASSLRDRLGLAAEARALSAQARYSAWVIGIAPVGYIIGSAAIDPRSLHSLLGTGAGRACALLGVGLEIVGRAVDARHRAGRRRGVRFLLGLACGSVAGVPFARLARRETVLARVRSLGSRPSGGAGARLAERLRRIPCPPAVASIGRVLGGPRARRRQRRQDAGFGRELPVVVDLVGVAVVAGCTPYLAIEHAARYGPEHTARALRDVSQACALGQSLDDALPRARGLGRRAATTR